MESAQLFDNQHAVKTIGLNQDLEKAQRIDWNKAINDDSDFPKYSWQLYQSRKYFYELNKIYFIYFLKKGFWGFGV